MMRVRDEDDTCRARVRDKTKNEAVNSSREKTCLSAVCLVVE